MDEKQVPQNEGLDKKKNWKKRTLLIGVGAAGVLLATYLLLCVWVGFGNTILPGVSVGPVELGGMTQEQGRKAISAWEAEHYDNTVYTLTCGDVARPFDGKLVVMDERVAVERAWQVGRSEPFLKRGAVILAQLFGKDRGVTCRPYLDRSGEREFDRILAELNQEVGSPLIESIWSVEGNTLTITRGTTGRMIDREQSLQNLLDVLEQPGVVQVELPVVTADPEPLNFDLIHDQIYVQAQDAQIDPDTYLATKHVMGVDFDVAQVERRFDQLAQGESMRVALDITEPEVTQAELNALLFRDELGKCETNIGGTTNRLNNVITAAKSIDGIVLAPGQVFSYNDALGPRTVENGYRPAPAYIGGQTVDEVGGGICQDSSTLYMAVLRANLNIVERTNHMYTVGYVPNGMDATVVYNAIDFKFSNDTQYPIRILAQVEGRKLTIRIMGTKAEPFTVKLVNETLATTPYEVIYKPDDSIEPGTTEVETTAYTGCKVRVYRCLYDGAGNLVSKTLESTNNYRRRDKVILYNPVDAASLGLVDAQGKVHETVLPVQPEPEPLPEPAPEPVPEPEPAPEPVPDPAPEPEPAPEPIPEPAPELTVQPETPMEPEPSETESEQPELPVGQQEEAL